VSGETAPADLYRLTLGVAPVIVSIPHAGTRLPTGLESSLTRAGATLPDTDWHVEQLYGFAAARGCTVLAAQYSRYLIDLNRPPDDAPLYPGQAHTGLCPTRTFEGEAIYRDGRERVAASEIAQRRASYWQPYHTALTAALEETKRRHGHAVLLDAHSIRSRVPRLFEGRLPDINLGTDDGRSCSAEIERALERLLRAQVRFSHVINGRFKGGYITRHYGVPGQRIHALQIELAQDAYMDEDAASYEPARAAPLRELLQSVLGALLEFRPPS
jgi:N-formylglutamate amidohydrolase